MLPMSTFCHNVKCPLLSHSLGAKGSGGMDMCVDKLMTGCMLFGQVKGPGHIGKPRKMWNDVVLSDIHHLSISRPYQVAQNKSAWRAQTCPTRT